MQFRPTTDHVLVKKVTQAEQKRGNIIIPTTFNPIVNHGVVVDCGPTVQANIKPDHQIVFDAISATPLTIDNEEFLIIAEKNILMIEG